MNPERTSEFMSVSARERKQNGRFEMSGMAHPPRDYSAEAPLDEPQNTAGRGPLGFDWGWWVALAAIAFAVVLGAVLVFGGTNGNTTQTVGTAAIVTEPGAYQGDRVVATGRIDELLTDGAIAMGSDLAPADLLVLIEPTAYVGGYGIGAPMAAPLPVGTTYEVGDVIQVSGTVRDFDRDAMSNELGLVLNDELFADWEGQPALVVDRLDVATVGRLNNG